MTDAELVEKKLARIETCLRELRTHARPERLETDVREERFVEHTLQIAIQAAIDAASHVVSDERLGEPDTQRQTFVLLAKAGWLETALADALGRMAGFRNVLVHGYDTVDLAVVRDVLTHRLGDLEAFVAAIRARLPRGD
ncbi:MAG: DUF86 domain-containing protein [Polyangiales bacterium]